jgi:hypothetical protein
MPIRCAKGECRKSNSRWQRHLRSSAFAQKLRTDRRAVSQLAAGSLTALPGWSRSQSRARPLANILCPFRALSLRLRGHFFLFPFSFLICRLCWR